MRTHSISTTLTVLATVLFFASSAFAQDAPPTPLDANFDGGNGQNNYGGDVTVFYGGGNPFFQDDTLVTSTFTDATGATGAAGDFAWNIEGNPNPVVTFPDFTFFGGVLQLSAGSLTPRNISGFAELQFDVALAATGTFDQWGVRLEDADPTGAGDFDNVLLPLTNYVSPLSTTYQTATIPLTDFTPGTGQQVDLTRTTQIVFTNLGGTPPPNSSVNVDLLLDNVVFQGTGTPIFDTPPTPLIEPFDDGNLVNNYGGGTQGFYGRGDPFVQEDFLIVNEAVDAAGTTGVAGDFAWRAHDNGTPLPAGSNFTFFGHIVQLSPSATTGQDLTGFNTLRFDARVGTASDHSAYLIRLEDTDVTGGGEFNNLSLPLSNYGTLGTTYSNFSIPLEDFVPGTGQEVDLTLVNQVVFGNGPLGAGPYGVDLFVDNFEILAVFDTPPTPLLADFNDGTALNNWGGGLGVFAGGGNPFFFDENLVAPTFEDGEGATGLSGDFGLHITSTATITGADFAFFGFFVTLTPGDTGSQDLTSFTQVEFDAKLGPTAGIFTGWQFRLEDTEADQATNGNQFNVDLSTYGTLTTAGYTHFVIPLSDFDASPANRDDIRACVFAGPPGAAAGSYDLDLFIDNFEINDGASLGVEDWMQYE